MNSHAFFNGEESPYKKPKLYKKLASLARGFKEPWWSEVSRDSKRQSLLSQVRHVLRQYKTEDLLDDLNVVAEGHVPVLHYFVTSLNYDVLDAIFEKLYLDRQGINYEILNLFYLKDHQGKKLIDRLFETCGKKEQLNETLDVLRRYSNPRFYLKKPFQCYKLMHNRFSKIESEELEPEDKTPATPIPRAAENVVDLPIQECQEPAQKRPKIGN